MPATAHACDPQASAQYRRNARRLRRVYADRSHELYGQLQHLAKQQDDAAAVKASKQRVTRSRRVHSLERGIDSAISSDATERFANLAALQFEGQVLRYSRRLALLRLAERMGIERFRASLVIAWVQHQLLQGEPAASQWVDTDFLPNRTPAKRTWFLTGVAFFCLLQSAIGCGVWFMLR